MMKTSHIIHNPVYFDRYQSTRLQVVSVIGNEITKLYTIHTFINMLQEDGYKLIWRQI